MTYVSILRVFGFWFYVSIGASTFICASLFQEGCGIGRYIERPKITLFLWVESVCVTVSVHAIYIIDFL